MHRSYSIKFLIVEVGSLNLAEGAPVIKAVEIGT